ncbi:MAG: formate transporter FocA [Bacteroidetes bacterium]|nr:formate transporter FocA [Bacteroidota bacterium]
MSDRDTQSMEGLLPHEMAGKAEEIGVAKAHQEILKTTLLAVLAGAFIAFGAVFATLVTSGSELSFGLTKLLGGIAFSLGLILVVVGGAELFTGNNLLTMAWASRKVSTWQMLRNWIIVYFGNMLGAYSILILMFMSGHYLFGKGVTGDNILHIAEAKCQLGFIQAIVLGILCNILVCLAIWLCYSARSTQGKILAIIFPITAFVAAGFEHSVANMYFIPMGLLVKRSADPELWRSLDVDPSHFESLNLGNYFMNNLLPVTIGNIIGGAVFVGLAYWFIYLRKQNSK